MKNPIAEAYIQMLQEKAKKENKMDPVGQADADIDNDGDVDDSDEYLHKRRKAIKKSMKKEEKTPCPKCDAKGCDHCDNTGYHTEAVEIETDDDKTDAEDPKAAKKKGPEKKKKEDPAATNAPSQQDRAAAADDEVAAKDDGEEKIVVKKKEKKDDEKEESVKKESFDWDAIVEMNEEQVDQFIDGLNEEQLDLFEAEMKSQANPEGKADEYNKDQQKFKDMHVKKVVDRPDADKPKDGTKESPKRPGDQTTGDKNVVKRLKDIRK